MRIGGAIWDGGTGTTAEPIHPYKPTPLRITFRHMAACQTIEARIREHVERLERFHACITDCHVVVEAPPDRRRHRAPFDIKIDLTVPGKEISVSSGVAPREDHDDVYVALRDAFDGVRRLLRNHEWQYREDARAVTEVRHMKLVLTSPAFEPGGDIPRRYTCEGEDISPPLEWTGVPQRARSLVLIVDDPDAPDPAAPKRTWVHWVLYNIPATAVRVAENCGPGGGFPEARDGLNDWGRTGYGGPCPPIGRHRYFHKLYAVDTVFPELKRADKASVMAAINGHLLAEATLIGGYQKRAS